MTAYARYTFKGEGIEVWEPQFTFHGFRYVELLGYPGEAITGIVLHSEMAQTGHFECSDSPINQLQSNILWGQKGNFVDVPTDCPQRDERLGWTGDIQVFARIAAFKWANDLADADAISRGMLITGQSPALLGIDWSMITIRRFVLSSSCKSLTTSVIAKTRRLVGGFIKDNRKTGQTELAEWPSVRNFPRRYTLKCRPPYWIVYQ